MKIINATEKDADLIATTIIEAIGKELTYHLAGESHTPEDIYAMFVRLAKRDDSQYSYLNSRVALNSEGSPMGVCVSYDGGDLRRLRHAFFEEANAALGWNLKEEEIENIPEECSPDEYYLDSIMTLSDYRGRGVAKALIEDAKKKAVAANKPLGLLCDRDNSIARSAYLSAGFKKDGRRPFAGHEMDHYVL